MKIPKTLKIGGHSFKVIEKDLANGRLGETDFTAGAIYIDKDSIPSIKVSVLFHEIICHCINTTFTGESSVAHGLMDSISEQLYQVFSDNKLLAR